MNNEELKKGVVDTVNHLNKVLLDNPPMTTDEELAAVKFIADRVLGKEWLESLLSEFFSLVEDDKPEVVLPKLAKIAVKAVLSGFITKQDVGNALASIDIAQAYKESNLQHYVERLKTDFGFAKPLFNGLLDKGSALVSKSKGA